MSAVREALVRESLDLDVTLRLLVDADSAAEDTLLVAGMHAVEDIARAEGQGGRLVILGFNGLVGPLPYRLLDPELMARAMAGLRERVAGVGVCAFLFAETHKHEARVTVCSAGREITLRALVTREGSATLIGQWSESKPAAHFAGMLGRENLN